MRLKANLLGLAFMAPAMVLLLGFFFLPAVLTGVFAFTNMSTATGITGGSYVITGNLLRSLSEEGLGRETIEMLGRSVYTIDQKGLEKARAANVEPKLLAEIAERLDGRTYSRASDFERDLKALPSRPTRVRDLKIAAEAFETSVLNVRYASSATMTAALHEILDQPAEGTIERIVEASYTGWTWTADNFKSLAVSPETWRIVANTVFYVTLTLAFNVLVGLFLAITTFYLPPAGASFFSVLWLLPRITPVVLYAVLWKWFTWDDGFLFNIARELGLPAFNYMKGSVSSAWTVVILVNGFVGASFGMILFSGALKAIPVQQLWASEVDGASRWQQIRYIILPQMRWPILFVTSYQTLSLLSSYQEIWLTTNGGPGSTTTVWALEAFKTALNNYTGNLQYGLGAAMALILVTVGLVLSVVYLRLFRFDDMMSKPRIEF
ncbi:carbohydrate ABC transporter permease [Neorhizobium sp. DT-125]|uniref:carbohydrate ABC transporter permease n=1 Tax=Neorhizobium sp. DT-125 TaxID=3396163 RepID=UPI003F1A3B22